MLNKLTEKFKTTKELHIIKKHFRVAKRHKSFSELEKVKFELIDFQDKITKKNQVTEILSWEMYSLFSEIDHARSKLAPAVSSLWPPFI